MNPTPPANPAEQQLTLMLESARESFAAKQNRKTLDTLHSAQAFATANGLHRHAAQLKRALSILSAGSRPKLLTQPRPTWGTREDR